MGFFDGKVSVFKIDDVGATLRDLSPYITELSGLPGPRPLNEVTAMGDSGAKFIPTIENVTINLSGWFDETATTGPDAVLGPLRTHTSPTDFEYGPHGGAASDTKYSGQCWVSDYQVRSRVGSVVEWTATLQVEGTVARGTF